jgi:hypothetical protein
LSLTVLHPRHKLKYFKNAGWEDEWIDAAENIVRAEYERKYANRFAGDDDDENNNRMSSPKKTKVRVHESRQCSLH